MSELQDIIITIDSREKNEKRIKAVSTWGKAQGAIVEHSKLDLCDYRILGDFRGHNINIGIEAKGLSDFCSCDYEDLKRKLFDSFEIYDEVALFIESANYSFLNEGFGKSAIINSAVRDGSANVCNLAQLEGCVHTLERNGIYVNQLRSEAQFPFSIENLLTYCIHDHDVVKQSPKMYLRSYKHTLKSFMTGVQVKKAITSYPNLHWLCSASEESYKEIFGKAAGTKIYNFVRNPELVTEEWKNSHFPDGTECDNPCGKSCEEVNAYDCVGKTCKLHPDYNKSLQSQCDPAGTVLSTHPSTPNYKVNPADANNKSTEGLTPLIISSVPIPITKCNVQEKGLKLVSSLTHIPPSPAITLNEEEQLFGKTNPDWKVETHRMSARTQLEGYLQKPHTLQECVDAYSQFTSGTIFEHVARMKREGVVIEFDDKTLVMAK